jgi:hypothetical protein
MHRSKDMFGIFLSRTHIAKTGIIEQGQQKEVCEVDIQKNVELPQ